MEKRSLKQRVLATMKSADTESNFELYVTRTPGYLWALLFKALHVHPIAVTLVSIVIGAACGHFFYLGGMRNTLIGIGLLIWANWYDCADGQLARMTNKRTLVGRLLDGLAGDIWFFCIYLGIVLNILPTYGWWVWLLFGYSGLHCHAKQCAIADYYRNIHLWIILGKEGSELDTFAEEDARYRELRWNKEGWFEKLYLFFYRGYTRGQERQTPRFQEFYRYIREHNLVLSDEMRADIRRESKPLMKYTNILTFDTRVGVLFIALLTGCPLIFPCFEIAVLEPLRFYMRWRHESFCVKYLNRLKGEQA